MTTLQTREERLAKHVARARNHLRRIALALDVATDDDASEGSIAEACHLADKFAELDAFCGIPEEA